MGLSVVTLMLSAYPVVWSWPFTIGAGSNAGVPAAQTELACTLPFQRVNASWPINSVDPADPSGACKERADVCPSIFLSLLRIWRELSKYAPKKMSKFVINVGAKGEGLHHQPK